jgi:hypothetical protein
MFGPIGLLLYITARFFRLGLLEYEETGDL